MKQSFNDFISQLSQTNSTLDFFVDFNKVNKNVENISIKLNQLNYLIGRENLNEAVHKLYKENPGCFSVLGIIIAVRDNKLILDDEGELKYIHSYFKSPENIIYFLKKTGLSEVFNKKQVKNLVDYVFGIEVGLDTNARKNRGGSNFEKAIAKVFTKHKIPFRSEVKHTEFKDIISFGGDVKRLDFIIKTKFKTYLIEANFYNSGGSKLNEVARAYSDLAPKINQYTNFEFVWITDGQGWHSAKNKLQEAYNRIPRVYNIKTLSSFIEDIKKEL